MNCIWRRLLKCLCSKVVKNGAIKIKRIKRCCKRLYDLSFVRLLTAWVLVCAQLGCGCAWQRELVCWLTAWCFDLFCWWLMIWLLNKISSFSLNLVRIFRCWPTGTLFDFTVCCGWDVHARLEAHAPPQLAIQILFYVLLEPQLKKPNEQFWNIIKHHCFGY